MRYSFAVLAFLIAAAGCSGGSSRVTPATSALQPGAAASAGPMATATVTITIPPRMPSRAARRPKFVPPTVNSITLQVNGASPVITNVTPGVSTYSLSLAVSTGNDTFAVSLFDGANGTGNMLGAGLTSALITSAGPNNVPVTISGKIASLGYNFVRVSTMQFTVSAIGMDADGNVISGTYLQPVALSDSDVSTHTFFNTGGTTATLPSSSSTVTLNWDGTSLSGCSAITVTGVSGAVSVAVPVPLGTNVVTNLATGGAGSLANAVTSGGTIVFAVSGPINVPAAINLPVSVDICGTPGATPSITLDGGGSSSIFNIASTVTANFANLKLQNGSSGAGGAVNLIGPATVAFTNVTFFNNITTGGGNGGAIQINAGNTSTFTNCTFTNNRTTGTGNGGAINNNSPLTINGTTFNGNQNTGSGSGAALYNNAGATTVNNSLFFSNGTAQSGGAIFVNAGSVNLNVSTVYSNNAASQGGGVAVTNGAFSATASTFAFGVGSGGGGNFNFAGGGSVNLAQSLVSNGTPTDFNNSTYTVNNSVVTSTNFSTIFGGVNNILNGAAPTFGSLSNNGGPTQTLQLTGGAGVGLISGPCAPSVDQRGVARPIAGGFCDAGAFEKT